MQIGATLPSQNLLFQTRRNSFNCRQQSTLNPTLPRPNSNPNSLEFTKHTIANLDKLLGTNVPQLNSTPQEPIKRVSNTGSLANRSNVMLEALNMVRVWPEMQAAEEMSPRHLNRLQRLLSIKSEYSPRNHLGSKWMEYHGSNDWTGLIDPLDENLRREVVRYGEFIQAAYHAFHSNPAMSTSEAPLPQQVALPDRNYKVTKSLYATSSVGLPKWVDDVAPDLGWMTQRSSWIGYVAVCDDKREIQRMGRREIVISLRGTSTCMEWAENVRAQLVDVDGETQEEGESNQCQPKVGCGFLSLYKTKGDHVESLAESVAEEVKRLMEQYKGETLSISVTGHSLGAALGLLVAHDLSKISKQVPPIAVFTFGGPKVGNKGFANLVKSENVKVLRIVNNQDVITRVPALPMVEGLNDNMAYSHVGTELRVDTKMSPYLKPNADVACCHDLEAYLHLVDGFMASNCPFRANAKRSLVKLLNDQSSNVKKLYTSKVKALSLNLERPGLHTPATCLPSPSS